MVLPYQQPGLTLGQKQTNDPSLVRALQHDLRQLGYLRRNIDGVFGSGTARAVGALRYDLLHNDGTGADGNAPVAVRSYNNGRVAAPITGALDQGLADCIADMLADPACPTLPFSATAAADNIRAVTAIAGQHSAVAPTPFLLAIVLQESNGLHFVVSTNANQDNFVVVGLDQATGAPPEQITSRGYGIGQYTLHHHPPTPTEIRRFIADPVGSVSLAYTVLREKLALAVKSPDRQAEHPGLPLRLCRFAQTDPRFQTDCLACARNAHKVDISTGTPFYPGATETYQPTRYHAAAAYSAVPDRADFGCDWPYAVRRYNGDGIDSYHYQAEVLPRLLNLPVTPTA
jgi:peptidoglycan hydrolase-like protein with peptidoglycan-binding domain